MKKSLSFLLAMLMPLGCLVACTPNVDPGHQTDPGDSTEEPSGFGTTPEAPTEEETVPDTGYPVDLFEIGGVAFSEFSLYVQPDAAEGITLVVNYLLKYAEEATGHKLTVTDDASTEHLIVIGKTDLDTEGIKNARSQIKNDGYAILEEGGKLFITGKNTSGTVYGVVTFMENYLGVRYYATDFIHVRDNPVVRIPADYCEVYSPAFLMRDTFWHDVSRNQEHAIWLKDNSGYLPEMEGGISYAGPFVHTLGELSGGTHEVGKQPCLTDETVYRIVLRNVKTWLRNNPYAKIISVSQNDSAAQHLGCQCENCKAIDEREGTPMGSLLTFVNRIAGDIKEEFPDVYVDTLAYRYTRKAPKTIKPADNVIIRLCSIECCFGHPLSDESCAHNVEFKKDIEEWSAICDNLYIWDYTTNFMTYLSPFPNLGVLRENVKFYKDHHVIGMFEQGNYQSTSGEFGELRAYLIAKLLWNPDMSEEEYNRHMNEFLEDYYGAGWQHIRAYIDMTTEAAAKCEVGIYDTVRHMMQQGMSNDEMIAFGEDVVDMWEKAYEEADTEVHKAHVEKSMVQAYFVGQLRGKNRKEYVTRMYEICEKYGITHFREGALIDFSQKGKPGSLG